MIYRMWKTMTGRLKNQILAKLFTRFPSLLKRVYGKGAYDPEGLDLDVIPWTPIGKAVDKSRVAIVTTAGVHLKDQTPFDMKDPLGDPTFREIPDAAPLDDIRITHDYYDHTDAEKDINIVFPVERLREAVAAGEAGSVAPLHFSFMGHIDGEYVETLYNETAPAVAAKLKENGTDIALFTPG